MIVKVQNNNGKMGTVDVESWANPKTQILDFDDGEGNTNPVYKDELRYIGVEEC